MMRLRPPGLALFGACLLATTQAAEFFVITDLNDININGQLFATKPKESLVFKYNYPRRSQSIGVSIAVYRESPQQPLLEDSLWYSNPRTFEPNPTAAGYRIQLQESPWNSADQRAFGNVTIFNPVEFAGTLSSGMVKPPPIYLLLKTMLPPPMTDPTTNSPPRRNVRREASTSVTFGLANVDLSQDPTAFAAEKKKFRDEAGNGGIDTEPEKTITTTAPTPTGGVLPNSTASLSADSGMSPGAIAGIAIGAVLGALLIGTALVWFFVRRRRQNKAGKAGLGYNGGSTRSGDLVAEKEANAIVAESPRSPYSEDRTHRDSTLAAGARETAGDYQPYSDNPTATANAPPPIIAAPVARAASANSRSTADRSSAAFPPSAPPPAIGEDGLPPRSDTGMSGRYAHLIEDNMTADEIARLEEEERQLDVAIEQARGVTTK
ncbi:hypothetical protein RB594_003066 [Gaeumannomyces avenae]